MILLRRNRIENRTISHHKNEKRSESKSEWDKEKFIRWKSIFILYEVVRITMSNMLELMHTNKLTVALIIVI